MQRKVAILIASAALFFGAFAPQPKILASSGYVTITADQLNVRQGPGLSFPVVKQVKNGDNYPILSEEGQWFKIDLKNGQKGWVANWFAEKKKPAEPQKSNLVSATSGTANSDGLRVRKGPGTSFRIVSSLKKGQKVNVLESNENWLRISGTFGEGWVSREYIDLQQSSKENDQGSEKAKETTGIITADLLNVRNIPSTSGKLLGKLSQGSRVKIYSQQKEWVEISFSNSKAWVTSEFIEIQDDGQPKESGSTEKPIGSVIGTVTATSLNVRESSALNARIIGSVTKGQRYRIVEEVNNWSKIELKPGQYGWIAGWYLDKSVQESPSPEEQDVKGSAVTVLQSGTNIRKSPNLQSDVILRANKGQIYEIKSIRSNWYEIKLTNGSSGFIAGWLVSVSGSAPRIEKPGAEAHLKNKTIVLDPGHGGEDSGTIGTKGTLEKDLTIRTVMLLFDKLKAAGANVILTRNNDTYISLRSRVSTSHYHAADAFVSIHYDSNTNRSVRGSTGYYYHDYQKPLAEDLYSTLSQQTGLKNRGVRFGDYHVLRENKQRAVLLELGYLSNPEDEMLVNSGQFQETASTGIYNGLARFFKDN